MSVNVHKCRCTILLKGEIVLNRNIIVLDFAECRNLCDIQKQLKMSFSFKEDFFDNWNKFWTMLEAFVKNSEGLSVEIHRYYMLGAEMRKKCRYMLEIFEDIQSKTKKFSYSFVL